MKRTDCLFIFLYGGHSYVTDDDAVGCGCYQVKYLFQLFESSTCVNLFFSVVCLRVWEGGAGRSSEKCTNFHDRQRV